MKGKLVVFEGIDGSGKKTQLDILSSRLKEAGADFKNVAFPRHGHPAGFFVDTYLQPDSPYGPPGSVPSKTASLFYALDRYDQSFEMKKWLDERDFVLADRYLVSNIGHQGGKIDDPDGRKSYVDWLYGLEYDLLQIPKPDLNIVFWLPAEIAAQRVEKKSMRNYLKGAKKDSHEADIDHLRRAGEAYLWAAETYPDFEVVRCYDNNKELSEEQIHERVWDIFSKRYGL